MNIKNIILKTLPVIMLILFINTQAKAQNWYGAFSYQISFPTGDTKDFADKTSFIGFSLDFRRAVAPKTTVGLLLGWNVFHERTSDVIDLVRDGNPGAVSGLQDRTLNSFPFMINAHKYFGKDNGTSFFAGLNAGGYYMLQQFDIGIYTFGNDQWQWGIIPEVGIVIPLQDESSLVITGKYHFAFTGESAVGTDISNQYISLGIGFSWNNL